MVSVSDTKAMPSAPPTNRPTSEADAAWSRRSCRCRSCLSPRGRRELGVAADPADLLLGGERTGGGPAQPPVPASPIFDVAAAIRHDLDHRFARFVEETVRSSAGTVARSVTAAGRRYPRQRVGWRTPPTRRRRSLHRRTGARVLAAPLVLAPGLRRTSGASSLCTPSAARTGCSMICRIVPQCGTAAV